MSRSSLKRSPPPPLVPLTPVEFKALAKLKGWSYKALANRWGMQPESLSVIARNAARQVRYDDMLRGLPDLHHLVRETRRFERQLVQAERFMKLRPDADIVAAAAVPTGPGYRYHGYIVKGSILTAVRDIGSLATEGDRGIVFDVQQSAMHEMYGIVFEAGGAEWFTPESIELYLVETGLQDQGIGAFLFEDFAQLGRWFAAGNLNFWPAVG